MFEFVFLGKRVLPEGPGYDELTSGSAQVFEIGPSSN